MKLSYYCNFCRSENFIKTNTTNRHDLLNELGKSEIENTCQNCGKHTSKHINRLYAEPNNMLILASVILAIIVTVFLWNYGFVSALSGTIPIAVWMDQSKKTSLFNKSRI